MKRLTILTLFLALTVLVISFLVFTPHQTNALAELRVQFEVIPLEPEASDGSSYAIAPSQTSTRTAYVPLVLRNYFVPLPTPVLPDLVVSRVNAEWEPGVYCGWSSSMGLGVWVDNIGGADADQFAVDVDESRQIVESGLAAGETAFLWFFPFQELHIYTVIVDATNQVRESDEDNNELVAPGLPHPTMLPTCIPTATPTPSSTATPTGTSTSTATPTSTRTPTKIPTPSVAPTQHGQRGGP